MLRLSNAPILALGLALVLCLSDAALACPTCKDGMTHDPHTASMIQGYFFSILFMMSMPFLILFGLGAYFFWVIRRARRQGYYDQPVRRPGSTVPLAGPQTSVEASR